MPATSENPVEYRAALNIRDRRRALRLTLREVAETITRLGSAMTVNALGRLERGERRINAGDLVVFALALDTTVSDLLQPTKQEHEGEDVQVTPSHRATTAAYRASLRPHAGPQEENEPGHGGPARVGGTYAQAVGGLQPIAYVDTSILGAGVLGRMMLGNDGSTKKALARQLGLINAVAQFPMPKLDLAGFTGIAAALRNMQLPDDATLREMIAQARAEAEAAGDEEELAQIDVMEADLLPRSSEKSIKTVDAAPIEAADGTAADAQAEDRIERQNAEGDPGPR